MFNLKKNKISRADLHRLVANKQAHTLVPDKPLTQTLKGYSEHNDAAIQTSGDAFKQGLLDVTTDRNYIIDLENTSNVKKEVILCPGLLHRSTTPGIIQTGAFRRKGDSVNDPSVLIASGGPSPIEEFLEFVYQNPTVILGFRVRSNSEQQIDKRLYVQPQNPFNQLNDVKDIHLGTYSDEKVYQSKVVTVKEDFIMDSQTRVSIEVAAQSKMSLTLFVGGSQNMTKLFRNKVMATKAQSTI